ncbi:hypothetical protein RRG08_015263 [Elysia crispata]|uniref:Uncharacterized protein n=1 Tax=Elysia crispata TaxID=231223 RepID=A0AAE1AU42_9GAST|nr:hypothetical protein RRG08_015263 [Elysia crispata]
MYIARYSFGKSFADEVLQPPSKSKQVELGNSSRGRVSAKGCPSKAKQGLGDFQVPKNFIEVERKGVDLPRSLRGRSPLGIPSLRGGFEGAKPLGIPAQAMPTMDPFLVQRSTKRGRDRGMPDRRQGFGGLTFRKQNSSGDAKGGFATDLLKLP